MMSHVKMGVTLLYFSLRKCKEKLWLKNYNLDKSQGEVTCRVFCLMFFKASMHERPRIMLTIFFILFFVFLRASMDACYKFF